MKALRLPLFAKILGWFFLNLVLLVVVFWVLLRSELRPDALISVLAGERSTRLAETAMRELQTNSPHDWSKILDRFSEINDVTFVLFRDDGGWVAGPRITIPSTVLDRVRPLKTQRPMGDPEGGLRSEPERGRGPENAFPGPEGRPPGDDGPRGPRRPVSQGGPPRGGPPPRLFVHTTEPDRYWMLFGMMVPDGPPGRRPVPARLALISDTFTANGLFFDLKPWIWAGAGVVVLSVLWWLPFIHRMTRTLTRLTRATEQIADGKFDVEIGEQGGDEIGRLGTAVSQMAGKLDGFVTGQKRFLGDVSHELCAPIARLQMAVGVLEMKADTEQQAYVEDIREELQEMSGLVNELLSFSKAGLRSKELPLESIELRPLVERVIERENTGSAEVQCEVPEGLRLMAEPSLLARAVGNLIRNACRYAGSAGPIRVTAKGSGNVVEIRVEDSGSGVPAEYLEKIFEPFFRIDPSRNRETGGTGLGLAIVRSCVASFGGTVRAENLEPKGFAVTISLQSDAGGRGV